MPHDLIVFLFPFAPYLAGLGQGHFGILMLLFLDLNLLFIT